ncbi:MAG: sulfur carrier protein ThiS [Candidatus Omnitrophica bacterium]|nr:sulfur carrier protein ThiS [Candidatus Omnitrophota bacterium]MBI3021479.1 sulfur carrier protein ThiS [Candidatus Omnitrophota bacterium]MBI3083111.1 sulfur carrier protein ThiS [Candidatus Omnitrophota bacterium]
MDVTINGETRTVPEGTTVSQLLETLGVMPERVVVEVNLTILKRAEYPPTILREGDRVEIVRFVGGGCISHQTSDTRLQSDVGRLTSEV